MYSHMQKKKNVSPPHLLFFLFFQVVFSYELFVKSYNCNEMQKKFNPFFKLMLNEFYLFMGLPLVMFLN